LATTSFSRIAKGDVSSALPASDLACGDGKTAGEAVRDVADARKNGNPMMIRHNPSQGTGQKDASRILLDFLEAASRQAAGTDGH
jgi:hypothetical protein